MFAGEVVIVAIILVLSARSPTRPRTTARSWTSSARCCRQPGSALLVFGVLRSSVWGWIQPKPGEPEWFNLSPTIWLILIGLFVIWLFFRWEARAA